MKNTLLHSVKITLACLLGWIIAKEVIHFPSPQIVIISSLLVLLRADDFGRALTKSYLRAIGALAGAGISWLILSKWCGWGQHPMKDYGLFVIVIFIFALLSQTTKKYQAAGLFGALTVISILISPEPNQAFVYIRFSEVIFGIGIALSVSGIFYPLNTKTRLKHQLKLSLNQLQQLYQAKFCGYRYAPYMRDPIRCETQILSSLGQQERLLLNGINLFMGNDLYKENYKKIIQCERGVFRSTLFLHRICQLNQDCANRLIIESASFHHIVADLLYDLAHSEDYVHKEQIWLHSLHEHLMQLTNEIEVNAEQAGHARGFYYTYLGACQYLIHELSLLLHFMLQLTHEVSQPQLIKSYPEF